MAGTQKLQVPQQERIRAQNVHVADAVQTIVNYVNQVTTPATGTKITPLNALK